MPIRYRSLGFVLALAAMAAAGSVCASEFKGLYAARYMGLKVPSLSASDAKNMEGMSFEKPGLFAGALGFRLSSHLRFEGEVTASKTDMARIDFRGETELPLENKTKSQSGFMNFYYDIEAPGALGGKFKPFLGAGAGYVASFSHSAGHDAGGFAWQLGAGLNYKASPDITFSSAYRFIDSPTSAYESDFGGHEFHVGMTYDLPYKPPPSPARGALLGQGAGR